jgi:hypothetical protein
MIVKFLDPSSSFQGVYYSTDKIAVDKAEFMTAMNFDALDGLHEIRPADYFNHLTAVSALNKGVSEPQLHVAISTTGRSHDKYELTLIAKAWLEKMGYAKQPYLIFFHKDTENNHVHIVSTRIDHEGRKVSSAFERVRGLKAMNQIMGLDVNETVQKDLDKAKSYRFSNIAQFKLILEKQGYKIKDDDLIKYGTKQLKLDYGKLEFHETDPRRATQLKAIFKKYATQYDTAGFADYLKTKMGIELVFHSKDGKPTYGYTVIDHAQKNVYKGSAIMSLKDLLKAHDETSSHLKNSPQVSSQTSAYTPSKSTKSAQPPLQTNEQEQDTPLRIHISGDIDDEAIHGARRNRKKKTRTNQR